MDVFYQGGFANGTERVASVTTGLVKANYDAQHPGMVKVDYFLGETGKNVTDWVPVASPYASKDCGLYLLPEIGAEVVIAYNMGDRNCPIVIGSLWNKKNELPKGTAVEKNAVKRFKTKGGCEVEFVDEEGKETIEVSTPKKLSIRIDDEKDVITISDKEGKNAFKIEAKAGNVSVIAEKKLELKSGKNAITLDGGGISVKGDAVKVEAGNALTLKGTNVKVDGSETSVSGKGKVSVKASGAVSVKGATVKLN